MAKKNPAQKMKYLEIVRKNTLAVIQKTEASLQNMKAFGSDFDKTFEKTRKRHARLLNKVTKIIDRERKKSVETPKGDVKSGKKAAATAGKPKPAASTAKPSTAKPKPSTAKPKPAAAKAKPSASKRGSPGQLDAIQ